VCGGECQDIGVSKGGGENARNVNLEALSLHDGIDDFEGLARVLVLNARVEETSVHEPLARVGVPAALLLLRLLMDQERELELISRSAELDQLAVGASLQRYALRRLNPLQQSKLCAATSVQRTRHTQHDTTHSTHGTRSVVLALGPALWMRW
jgi:hypothetical protein